MNERLINYINSSFISPLLNDDEITDITYNGVSVFYVHNKKGRLKSEISVTSNEALDFIRQIANYSEKQFSYAIPVLDVSVGKYRINAVHPLIVRVNNDKSCSFAIRINSDQSRIKDDKNFINEKCLKYLINCLEQEKSIVIAGPTGSGKTELQKYLLSLLRENTRVIVIDNVQELENLRSIENLDLTSWQISQNNTAATMEELIRNALRSNPDWIIVAEARGKEMNEVLNSAMTGHPIITTVHAKSIEVIPKRLAKLVLSADTSQKHEDILEDIYDHLGVYVFLGRKFDKTGNVIRYVDSIGEINNGKLDIVYKK